MTDQKVLIADPRKHVDVIEKVGGGKAKGMLALARAGVPYSPFFVITEHYTKHFLLHNNVSIDLLSGKNWKAEAEKVRDQIISGSFDEVLFSSLLDNLKGSELEGQELAVRSSGLDEDSSLHSFAGQFETFLYQKEMEDIQASIKLCIASGFSERCLAYRKQNGFDLDKIGIAIVVQKMVDAKLSGVAFSRNPIHPADRENLIVDSVYGIGEGLVSGRYDSDSYVVSRSSLEFESKIASKTHMLVKGEKSGLVEVEVASDLADKSSLTDEQVRLVAGSALKLEKHLDFPVDIEWAFDENDYVVLQCRPITNLPPEKLFSKSVNGESYTLWDNSNIVESYSGVTSPFTFSFASSAYRQVYVQFCAVMGVPAQKVEENEATFRNMLGLVRGRIYYNLVNWYKLILLLPGSSSNKDFMETMMGVKKNIGEENADIFDFVNYPVKYSLFSKFILVLKTLFRFLTIEQTKKKFKDNFNYYFKEAKSKDFAKMSLVDQLSYYQMLNDNILSKWKAPIINDYLCMVFFGGLKKLCAKHGFTEKNPTIHNDLISGEGDVTSTEPTKHLVRIAIKWKEMEGESGEISSMFQENDGNALAAMYKAGKLKGHVESEVASYLDLYGFRCVNELKLEESDLFEDPSFIFSILKNYLTRTKENLQGELQESSLRENAEKTVEANLTGLKKRIFNWVLKHARLAIARREDLRFDRTKIFGIVRRIVNAAGEKLCELGATEEPKDVFYLTVEELLGFVEGRAVTTDLSALIAVRKREFERYKESFDPPERFSTRGAASLSFGFPDLLSDMDLLRDKVVVSDDPNVLLGTPCCPGKVEGRVLVAATPEDAKDLNGEILVTSRTDPGWVPLYPSAKGLLIERGSLLSHSAVVAREMSLPTIVGISGGLLEKLSTGDVVSFDGATGEIKIIRDENGSDALEVESAMDKVHG